MTGRGLPHKDQERAEVTGMEPLRNGDRLGLGLYKKQAEEVGVQGWRWQQWSVWGQTGRPG